jgi:hypothetical protein
MSPEISSAVPDLAGVLAARRRIEPYLRPTPLYRYPALDETAGARVWVKHENHQPVGAFKGSRRGEPGQPADRGRAAARVATSARPSSPRS